MKSMASEPSEPAKLGGSSNLATMDEPEELLDLVDKSDTPIGAIRREEILSLEANGRGFTRAVGVFLVNSSGLLWIPKRQPHKKIAPGGLDFSAGEHVQCGEPYDAAALRGLTEELNIDTPDPDKLTLVGSVAPFPGIPYFHNIYLYHTDVAPDYNRNNYSGYEWIESRNLAARLAQGEKAKEILLPSVQLILHN